MSEIILIRGPLGVGKTTISKELAKQLNASYFSVDGILEELQLDKTDGDGIPVKNFISAQEHILPLIKVAMDNGKGVIIDGNFYHKEQLDYFAKKFGEKLHVYTLHAPIEACIERDHNR